MSNSSESPSATPASGSSLSDHLAGKSFLVTGGTGGLGAAVSLNLLAAGGRVTVTYIVEKEFAALQAAAREQANDAFERLTGYNVDLLNESDVEAFFVTLTGGEARLDGLVHIAGGFVYAGLGETTTAQFELMWNLNFRSLFLCARAAYPLLKANGGGAVVTIGARPGLQGSAGLSAYAASKAAVINFTQTLADEGRPDGIRAFSVLPSIIDTPANRAAMPDADHESWVSPASLARVIRFVLEDESREMSGAVLPVYGGA